MEATRAVPGRSRVGAALVLLSVAAVVAGVGLAAALALRGETTLYAEQRPTSSRPPTVTSGRVRPPAPTQTSAPVAPPAPAPAAGPGLGEDPGPPTLGPAIDRILESLPRAQVAFNAPATLQLEEPAVVQLLLSGRRSIRTLQRQLTELGVRAGATIKASDSMEAHLSGSGFKIEAITPAVQLASGAGVTEWKWEVEPTKAGTRRLHLSLSALVDLKGKESAYTVRTFERTLEIDVPLRERLTGFVGTNWQWLWTALLIPACGWFLRRRRSPVRG